MYKLIINNEAMNCLDLPCPFLLYTYNLPLWIVWFIPIYLSLIVMEAILLI